MSGSTPLERRYRRLLALYPKAFRREHEQEMLSVLMDGAGEDQQRPRRAEATDLIAHGASARMRNAGSWERRHPAPVFWVRLLTAVWLIILTIVLCSEGYWWGLALLAPVALHLYFVYRLGRVAYPERPAGGPPSSWTGRPL